MTDANKPLRAVCIVCGQEKDCTHSLKLSRADGVWKSNPVCKDDRTALIRQAKSEGMFIPFYSLATSEEEARKRNDQAKRLGSFVSKYGKADANGGKSKQETPAKGKVVAGKFMIAG